MSYAPLLEALKGGATSGNWGHTGRPGKRGGSTPGGGHGQIGASGLSPGARHRLITGLRASRTVGGFPSDPTKVRVLHSVGGTTGAMLVEGPDGKRYIRKTGKNAGHVREEAAADAAYRAAGIDVPKFKLYETPDGPVKLTEFIEGHSLNSVLNKGGAHAEAAIKAAQKGFAADALFSNRDSIGLNYDNILIDNSGKAWRIDNGGSLRYRAQGAKKSDWGDDPKDFFTLRDDNYNREANRIFGGLSTSEIKSQVQSLSKHRDAILKALPAELRSTVSNRLDRLQDMANQ